MRKQAFRIVPMRTSHIPDCEAIVAGSDPWRRLHERVDFRAVLRPNRMNTRAYVCILDNKATGFVLFNPEPVFARGGYLRAIGVDPRFRRNGIGTRLLSFAEKSTSRKARHFFLCTSSFNKKAQTFYKQCGYAKVGTLRGIIIPNASEHIYWKRLTGGSSTGARTSRR